MSIEHRGGTLLDHVVRTADTLAAWGGSPALVLAGLCHAAYGTDGFADALLDIDERRVLRALIGRDAESIVYLYGSCDRRFLYPQLGRPEPRFRDRFTSRLSTPTAQRVRGFVELTFANELDVLRHDEDLLRRNGLALADLFVRCRELVSVAAYDAFRRFVDARLHSFGESRENPARRD